VNSDHSIECKFCGNSLIGVGPNIQIVCLECFAKTQEAMDRLSKLDEELGL
jgi:NMD protein affecting ribosome stability and mRNA decay